MTRLSLIRDAFTVGSVRSLMKRQLVFMSTVNARMPGLYSVFAWDACDLVAFFHATFRTSPLFTEDSVSRWLM